ncbi:hypothetical protein DFH28DRAFT_897181 [Melampsora americana]|nr:hypothetical protein DFH28DRAFT_897181 [Melampsora americana]
MNYTSQWEELHHQIQHELSSSPSPTLQRIFVACLFLSPLAGILYGLSAIKRVSERSERWLIRKNPSGFLYPNTCVVIPIWAVLYTIADVISLIMCQINSSKKSIKAPPLHGAIELVKYSLFLGMIWSTVYAIPRSKFQLQKNQSKLTSSRPDRCLIYLAPILFNLLFGLGYLIPLSLSGLMCVWTSAKVQHVAKLWNQIESSNDLNFNKTINQNQEQIESNSNISNAIQYLNLLKQDHKSLKSNLRLIAFLYITITAIISVILLISTFIILKALFFQLKIYKRLAINSRRRSPRTEIRLNSNSNQTRNFNFNQNLQSIHSTLSTQPHLSYSNQLTESIQRNSKHSHLFKQDEESLKEREFVKESVWDWIPSFKKGTGIDPSMWDLEFKLNPTIQTLTSSHHHPPTPTTTMTSSSSFNSNLEKYRILKRYIVNTIWQQVLILILISSYIIMHLLVVTIWCKNESGLPFTQIYLNVVEWANLTWNLGLGASLGLISCIVAFSPTPKRREENHQTDYDFCSEDS